MILAQAPARGGRGRTMSVPLVCLRSILRKLNCPSPPKFMGTPRLDTSRLELVPGTMERALAKINDLLAFARLLEVPAPRWPPPLNDENSLRHLKPRCRRQSRPMLAGTCDYAFAAIRELWSASEGSKAARKSGSSRLDTACWKRISGMATARRPFERLSPRSFSTQQYRSSLATPYPDGRRQSVSWKSAASHLSAMALSRMVCRQNRYELTQPQFQPWGYPSSTVTSAPRVAPSVRAALPLFNEISRYPLEPITPKGSPGVPCANV